MDVMEINDNLLAALHLRATASERKRMNYDLRNDENEQSQRMLNVLLPGTKSPIHRHTVTSETVVCLEGTCIERYYDNEGNETECFTLSAGSDLIGLQIPAGQFHSIDLPEEWKNKCVILEFKAGMFEPAKTEDILKV